MQETNLKLVQTQIAKEERRRRLAQAYAVILAWPDPHDAQTEPAAENLDGSTAAGSASEVPADADIPIDSNIIQEVAKEIQMDGSFNSKKGNNHGQ